MSGSSTSSQASPPEPDVLRRIRPLGGLFTSDNDLDVPLLLVRFEAEPSREFSLALSSRR